MKLPLSGSQTVGPYFAIGMGALYTDAIPMPAGSDPIIIEGRLLDGEGEPVPDGVLEIWQSDPQGSYSATPSAEPIGFARISTAPDGSFRFTTTKPDPIAYDSHSTQAPHLLVLVYARGLQRNLVTRMYFPDESSNAADPILQLVPAERCRSLIATLTSPGILQWDIHLRGNPAKSQPETVFFAW